MSYYAKRFFGQQGIVTDGLKLWLDASNPASYPGSGTTWYDLSGNANNGIMMNGVAYNTINSGMMSFDGVNDYVSVIGATTPATSFTISLYIRPSNTSLLKGIYNSGNQPNAFNMILFSNRLDIFERGIVDNLTNTQLQPYNTYNLTLIKNGDSRNNIYIYINGVLDSAFPKSFGTISTPNNCLFGIYNNNDYYLGLMNDILVYHRALNQTEVLKNFNATKSKYGL